MNFETNEDSETPWILIHYALGIVNQGSTHAHNVPEENGAKQDLILEPLLALQRQRIDVMMWLEESSACSGTFEKQGSDTRTEAEKILLHAACATWQNNFMSLNFIFFI